LTDVADAVPEMRLSVKYSGYEADRGRMSALDLGPAIFGVGEIFGQASRILYNDDARVRIEVRADFAHASFGIEFIAVSATGLAGLTWQQLSNIATVLGIGGGAVGAVRGAIGLYRWQRGREIDSVERVGDQMRLTINDQSVNVAINEYQIFVNPEVRKGFKALVEPMEREGIERVSIQADDQPEEVIQRQERASFLEPPLPEGALSVDRSTAILEIISISFREGNKWRFAQGGSAFHAEILDEEFLAKVRAQRELFGAGDALRVEMQIETKREGGQLKYERRINHEIEHLRADSESVLIERF
jgi:hypothetical protein